MTERALGVLGIARRAGKLSWGFDTAVEAARSGEAKLLLLAGDLSEKTKKNAVYEAGRSGVPLMETAYTMEDIAAAMGKKTGVLAVLDEGFAKSLCKSLKPADEREECCL